MKKYSETVELIWKYGVLFYTLHLDKKNTRKVLTELRNRLNDYLRDNF